MRSTPAQEGNGRGTVAVERLDTPVGRLTVAGSELGVCGISFGAGADRQPGPREYRDAVAADGADGADGADLAAAVAAVARDRLVAYFAGDPEALTGLAVDWRFASRVQRQVLGALYETVGFGEVVTYGELARRSGTAIPARAVGSVMGANPIPILVPCHRVVASTGLGGYSGGTGPEVKRWLLTLEGVLAPTLDWDPAGHVAGTG